MERTAIILRTSPDGKRCEVHRGGKTLIVIMGALHEKKKTTKNTNREIATIRNVGSYTYPEHKIHERKTPKKPC